MTSLHDVAKVAGVSKSTVSRVVNNECGVKPATRAKVMQAVEQVGYVVNQVAKDLQSQTTNLVGVIVPRVSSNAIAQGVDGLSRQLEAAGKQVLLANCQQDKGKEIDYIHLFNQKRVAGILLYASELSALLIEAVHRSRVPVVVIGQDGSLHDIPSIVHDDLKVGFEAGRRLLAAGCERVGFIGVTPPDPAVDTLRCNGLKQALSFHQANDLLFHSQGEFSIESGYQQMQQILTSYPEVDGVFCATDRIAVGAIKALGHAGNNQVKVLGVGNEDIGAISTPSLSTFDYRFEQAGESAGQVLLDMIAGKQVTMSKLVLSSVSVERESC